MSASSLSGIAAGGATLRDICHAIPALFLTDQDFHGMAAILSEILALAAAAGCSVIPASSAEASPDVFATLWFIRASHLLGAGAATGSAEATFFSETLLPLSRKFLQELITDKGIAGIRMDDGGLLIPPAGSSQALRLNALWYSALETASVDLKAAGDRVADHFERLSGRFRRSFAKAYWCDAHTCICPPESRVTPDHGILPDADQLLLTCLPASPIPRTKQRQLLQRLHATSLGQMGVRVPHAGHAFVESPMHLAWLARGWFASADPPASGLAEAAGLLQPLHGLLSQAHQEGMPEFYLGGEALPGQTPSLATKAEVLAAIKMLK